MKELQTTINFLYISKSYKREKRYCILQGGTRSSKTYSILQWLVIYALKNPNKIIDAFRKTRNSIALSLKLDFFEILESIGLTREGWKEGDYTYTFPNGTIMRFVGLDDPYKIRGQKRDIAFINEANKTTVEDFQQIDFRLSEFMIIDYNPSGEFWVQSMLLKQKDYIDDTSIFISTYKDNPHLSKSQIKTVERLERTDPYRWRVYGLGLSGIKDETIFRNWQVTDEFPECNSIALGLDFGWNDPNALIELRQNEDKLYVKQHIFQSAITPDNIINKLNDMVQNNLIQQETPIVADSARPEIITQIQRAGFNIHSSKKGANSVFDGIQLMKDYEIFIHEDSKDLISEFGNYCWKLDKDEKPTDIAEDKWNHGIDAIRYGMQQLRGGMDFDTIDNIDFLF